MLPSTVTGWAAAMCIAFTATPMLLQGAGAPPAPEEITNPLDCETDLDFFTASDEPAAPVTKRPPMTQAERTARRHIHVALGQETPLTPANLERLDAIIDVAREVNPELAKRLRELRESDPAAVIRALQTSGRKLQGMAELKQRDPEAYKFKVAEIRLERLIKDVATRLRKATRDDSGEAPALRAELRKHIMVRELIATRARAIYLQRLKTHIAHLEASLNRDTTQLQETVDRRLDELLKSMEVPADAGQPALAVDRSE